MIWFPPGEKHWHGATATTALTHIAIQEKLDGKTVDWMEKVSDEQYQALRAPPRDVGFDPVDAGPLRIARYLEPFSLLVGQLAYEGDGGPEIVYRFQRFGK